jgi:parallel beta-helix repeat protein
MGQRAWRGPAGSLTPLVGYMGGYRVTALHSTCPLVVANGNTVMAVADEVVACGIPMPPSTWEGYGPNPTPEQPPAGAVLIQTTDSPATIINAQPAGTVFAFATGVHRLTAKLPVRAGDTFWGHNGAIVTGSRLLTSFTQDGPLWYATGQTQEGWRHTSASCMAGSSRCAYPEDLFIDDQPLKHVGTLGEVASGKWFFDYAADRIYFADNPAGKKVETSVLDFMIQSDAPNLTIRNLIIEKFANPPQRGPIIGRIFTTPNTFGANWLIQDNTIRLNHGSGLSVGYGARVINNAIVRNGQIGINGGWGNDTLIEGNEIAHNNWVGFAWGWEAGGTKWYFSDRLVVRRNHSHHNAGPGLWTDGDNFNTVYEYNLIEDNDYMGIHHEISYEAVIRHNTVVRNGQAWGLTTYEYTTGCGIMIASSRGVEIHDNYVMGNIGGGIVGLQQDRGSGADGPLVVANLYVHDNDVGIEYAADRINSSGGVGGRGLHGCYRNSGEDGIWSAERNNSFQGNRYFSTTPDDAFWYWAAGPRNFSTWQGYGHDTTGTLTAL